MVKQLHLSIVITIIIVSSKYSYHLFSSIVKYIVVIFIGQFIWGQKDGYSSNIINSIKNREDSEFGEATALHELFSVDMFVIASIVKQNPFCKNWIEIGSNSGAETLWLRSILDSNKQLYSFDPNKSRTLLNSTLVDIEEINLVYSIDDLLGIIKDIKGMGGVIVHDLSNISYKILGKIADQLPEYSLIVLERKYSKEMERYSNEQWSQFEESLFWTNVDSSLKSSLILMEKITEKGFDPTFPWSLYPVGAPKKLLHVAQPSKYNVKENWMTLIRIQKCGTKTLVDALTKKLLPHQCTREFLVSPAADALDCRLFNICQDYLASKIEFQKVNCRKLFDHHCDWMDVFTHLDEEDSKHKVITILRDPVHRVLSEYKHVYKTHKHTWDYCPSEEKSEPFSRENFMEFVRNKKNKVGMWNRQTKMLAGCGSTKLCEEIYESEADMLHEAKLHLLRCDVVGILERFGDMLLTFNYLYDWVTEEFVIHREARDDLVLTWGIDDEISRLVLEYNSLDHELYEFAVAIVDYRTEQMKKYITTPWPKYDCEDDVCYLNGEIVVHL